MHKLQNKYNSAIKVCLSKKQLITKTSLYSFLKSRKCCIGTCKNLESTCNQTYAQLFMKDICANSEKFEILCIIQTCFRKKNTYINLAFSLVGTSRLLFEVKKRQYRTIHCLILKISLAFHFQCHGSQVLAFGTKILGWILSTAQDILITLILRKKCMKIKF